MSPATVQDIAKMIDHSLLHPTMTDAQVKAGLELSRAYRVATACVKPYSVPLATEMLAGSGVGVCAVVGFPHGNCHTSLKIAETLLAIREGATEIDMVVNNGKVLGGDWTWVSEDIGAMQAVCAANNAILKVIFENDYLQEAHIIKLCEICSAHRVGFVKTSTGYGFVKQASGEYNYKGATFDHLRLMRQHCPASVQIKAAGGIRTLDDTLKAREIGVTRIGATATPQIVAEAVKRQMPGFEAYTALVNGGAKPATTAGY